MTGNRGNRAQPGTGEALGSGAGAGGGGGPEDYDSDPQGGGGTIQQKPMRSKPNKGADASNGGSI
jgi:hypothetical protein